MNTKSKQEFHSTLAEPVDAPAVFFFFILYMHKKHPPNFIFTIWVEWASGFLSTSRTCAPQNQQSLS